MSRHKPYEGLQGGCKDNRDAPSPFVRNGPPTFRLQVKFAHDTVRTAIASASSAQSELMPEEQRIA